MYQAQEELEARIEELMHEKEELRKHIRQAKWD